MELDEGSSSPQEPAHRPAHRRETTQFIKGVRDYAIFTLEVDGVIASWNDGAERIKQYSADEIVGQSFSKLYPEDVAAAGKPSLCLKRALAQGSYAEEGWRVRKDGSRFWADVLITPIFDEAGQHLGFSKVVRDITEKKHIEAALKASEERYRSLFEGLLESFCVIEVLFDATNKAVDYVFLETNPTFEAQGGLSNLRGHAVSDVLPNVEPSWYEVFGKVALTGIPMRHESYSRAVGRWHDAFIYRIGGANSRKVGVLFNDVTERKKMERQLHEAVQIREDFLAVASHELSTPLTAILLKLARLRRQISEPVLDPTHLANMVTGAIDSANRMTTMLDKLLDLTSIRNGHLNLDLKQIDLRDLIRKTIASMAETIEQAGVAVTFECDGPVIGSCDPGRIEQVLCNLISNAVRYGAGKPVEITLRQNAGTRRAKIVVRDHGPGVPPQQREQIFERYERLNETDKIRGLGLGLYIVRELVEAHHGSVWVEDAQQGGASFVCELPY